MHLLIALNHFLLPYLNYYWLLRLPKSFLSFSHVPSLYFPYILEYRHVYIFENLASKRQKQWYLRWVWAILWWYCPNSSTLLLGKAFFFLSIYFPLHFLTLLIICTKFLIGYFSSTKFSIFWWICSRFWLFVSHSYDWIQQHPLFVHNLIATHDYFYLFILQASIYLGLSSVSCSYEKNNNNN